MSTQGRIAVGVSMGGLVAATIPFLGMALAMSCFGQADRPKPGPADTHVIAVVLGRQITVSEKDKLDGLIFGSLQQQFAKENQIEPTDEELDAFVRGMEEKDKQLQAKWEHDREKLQEQLKSSALSDRERKDKESHLRTIESLLKKRRERKEPAEGTEEQMRQVARQFVKSWKINKALYERYGGRVIFQQAGAEPLDAYRDFLKEQEKAGAFQILDKTCEASFWRYFTDDAMHTFYSKDDGAKFMNTPWWLMQEPPEK